MFFKTHSKINISTALNNRISTALDNRISTALNNHPQTGQISIYNRFAVDNLNTFGGIFRHCITGIDLMDDMKHHISISRCSNPKSNVVLDYAVLTMLCIVPVEIGNISLLSKKSVVLKIDPNRSVRFDLQIYTGKTLQCGLS